MCGQLQAIMLCAIPFALRLDDRGSDSASSSIKTEITSTIFDHDRHSYWNYSCIIVNKLNWSSYSSAMREINIMMEPYKFQVGYDSHIVYVHV